MARFDLTDDEWAVIAPLLPAQGRGPRRKGGRKILNGLFYILRFEASWRDLPDRYGPRTMVYNRYVRWGERGIWQRIFESLAQECEDALVFIVKAHHAAAGSKKGIGRKYWTPRDGASLVCPGGSRGGRTRKVHTAVDTKGRPLRLAISGGQLHDSLMMGAFLDWEIPSSTIVADKAYGSAKIRQQIADEGALAVIPSKSSAREPIPNDARLYRHRNVVERFFCKMKDRRRLATRFEKKAQNFLSMVQIIAIRCWAN